MEPVQAVEVGYPIPVMAQDTGQSQQAQWGGPVVVGGKIVNPGVYQRYMGCVAGR